MIPAHLQSVFHRSRLAVNVPSRLTCGFLVAILFLAWLFLPMHVWSQGVPLFDHLIPTEALTTTSTTAIIQDHKGYIWIGTTNGLNRFDGRDVTHFFHSPSDSTSISNSNITYDSIIEHNNTIWIGTENGLNKYHQQTGEFKSFHHNPADESSLCNSFITAIIPADSSSLWIGTANSLCRLNIKTGEFSTVKYHDNELYPENSNFISSLALDASKNLWIGTYAGLFRFNTENQSYENFLSDSTLVPVSHPKIYKLLIDDNKLWIGAEYYGIFLMQITTGEVEKKAQITSSNIGNTFIADMLLDTEGQLWIATFGEGLCRVNVSTNKLTCLKKDSNIPSSLIDDQVMSLVQDYEGHLWVSTWHGVTKMNRNRGFSTAYGSNILSDQRVNTLYEDTRGDLWLGTISSGLSKLDTNSGSIISYTHVPGNSRSISSNEIWSITGNSEVLWIGTASGLNQFELDSKLFTRYFHQQNDPNSISDNIIYSVFLDNVDSLWIGTATGGLNKLISEETGVFKRNLKAGDTSSISSNETGYLTSNVVWPIYQEKADILWIGTLHGGLNKLYIKENRFEAFQFSEKSDSLNSNDIIHITGDDQGNLWIGTQGSGLNKFSLSEEKFTAYTELDGLANNEVSCVIPDNHHRLWIGTRKGLSVFDRANKTFVNFHKPSGLQSINFLAGACLKSSDGKFHFGTDEGLLSFFPDSIDIEVPSPRLNVSEFRVNNKISQFDSESTKRSFKFEENTLSFRVSMLTYSSPQENQLYYRMSGLDTTWLPVETSGLISFTTLPANDYTLEVKGKNSFGVYNDRPLKLEITINPPYWDTWWFRLLAGFLTLSIIAAIFRTRVNFLLATEREAVKIEKLRTELAADFHDNIGTGLGRVGLNIDSIANHEDTPAPVRDKLLLLRESINNLSDMRREIGWIINPKNDSIGKLADRITEVAYDMIPNNLLSVTIAPDLPDKTLTMDTRRHLLHFVKEALSNALRHAQASHIQLSINSINDVCTITIMDNGIGFDPDNLENKNGEGLKTMDYRATEVGGNLQIKRSKTGGTVVQLDIKYREPG